MQRFIAENQLAIGGCKTDLQWKHLSWNSTRHRQTLDGFRNLSNISLEPEAVLSVAVLFNILSSEGRNSDTTHFKKSKFTVVLSQRTRCLFPCG